MPAIERTVPQRLQPAAGVAVLALTATDWLVRSVSTQAGRADRTFSFWGMFESVPDELAVGLGLTALILVIFVGVSILIDHTRPAAATVSSWLAALATLIVLLNIDSGYSAGPGLWLTLIVCLVTAVAGSIDWLFSANGALRRVRTEVR